jgi:hypothetical protein
MPIDRTMRWRTLSFDEKCKRQNCRLLQGSQEEAIMAANAAGEDDVVADFALEDEVFKALAPHEDPDVLVYRRSFVMQCTSAFYFSCVFKGTEF